MKWWSKIVELQQVDGDAFFAVFDGHLGAECANYSATHIASRLIAREEYATSPEAALRAAMVDLDERLTAKCKKEVTLLKLFPSNST